MTRVAVLVSGNGSNLQAILEAEAAGRLGAGEVVLVVSNRRDAYALQRATQAGVPHVTFPLAPYRQAERPRADYDRDLAAILQTFEIEWVVLAGWMHVLGDAFLRHFYNRVVNLHPALPGAFTGTDAIRRAYEAFQRGEIEHTGVMVHLVPDPAIDAGPVLAQEAVALRPGEDLATLEARIHAVEHRLLVETLASLWRTDRE